MKLKNEKMVYDGWRKVVKKEFIYKDRIFDFEIKKEELSACILPITKNGNVILAKQFRPGPQKILNELPGGGVEKGENPTDAAERELLEETGFKGKLIQLGSSWDCGYSTRYRHHFISLDCEKVREPENNPNEPIEVIELPIKDFIDLVHSGELTDSETAYRGLEYLKLL